VPGAWQVRDSDLASPIHLQYRLDGVDPVWLNADAPRTAIYTTISLQQGPILGEFFRRDFSLFL
jgi:hypothetical protein